MRRASVFAIGAFALALALFAVFSVRPWLNLKRDFPAAVPNPPPLDVTELILVNPRQHMCMSDIALDPHGDQARFKVGTYHSPGPPLLMTIRGAGYSVRAPIAAGFADNSTLQVPVRRPPRAELVEVCISNLGHKRIALYSSSGRSKSRALVSVDGKSQDSVPMFALYESKPVSIGARIGVTLSRIATFRGPFSHDWIVWALALLLVFGVPLALGAALWLAFSAASRPAAAPGTPRSQPPRASDS